MKGELLQLNIYCSSSFLFIYVCGGFFNDDIILEQIYA